MDPLVPAKKAVMDYFRKPTDDSASWRGRSRTTLPVVLNKDLQSIGSKLKTTHDLDCLCLLASQREEWRLLRRKIAEVAQAKLSMSIC